VGEQEIPTAKLFAKVPSTAYDRLIMRHRYEDDTQLAFSYHEAATRLASTYKGDPIDDRLLLPFLSLYRQAFELQMKETIREFASLRRRFHAGNTADVASKTIEDRLRHKIGHNLHGLLTELQKHYVALEIDGSFPKSTEKLLLLLHDADASGTAFRYTGGLPDTEDRLDFPDLVRLLDDEFRLLGGFRDYVTELYAAGPQPEDEDWD
jgi:hypothetical protein